MHHDDTVATAAGMPSVFGHGMLSMGVLAGALTDWVGAGRVRRMRVRFSRPIWPGETLATRVVAIAKREEEGRRLVDLECVLASSTGERKVVGEATVELIAGA
jgi:acyl dehydratase